MKNKTISIGHKNPDTDSILSAILVSRFGKKMFNLDIMATRAGEINNETKYILRLLKIKKPELLERIRDENVIIVDTTEPSQIADGLTEDNLLAIIDHHNLGGLKSSKPVYCRVEPMGCTSSIIYKILREKNTRIDKVSAILIIAGIISDTLNFASPTTTAEDKVILKELNKIAKLNIGQFAKELFEAKSSLEGITIEDIISKDYKQFDMGKYKVGIGVWETVSPETVNLQKEEIITALLKKKENEKMNYMFFAVVDIIKNNSYLYIIDDEEKSLAEEIFGGETKSNIIFLKNIVSRKKQIAPVLMKKLS